jgi:hypothetical protein
MPLRLGRLGAPERRPEHLAEWDPSFGWLHIDEDFFNGANAKTVDAALLHEEAHRQGWTHPHNLVNGAYIDYPFDILGVITNSNPGNPADFQALHASNNQCLGNS